MSFVLAWIIVGFCSFLIQQNHLNKVLPRYSFGIMVAGEIEKSPNGEDLYTPENIKTLDLLVRGLSCLISILLAPWTLYTALMTSFGFRQAKVMRIKERVDAIVRRKGQLIF